MKVSTLLKKAGIKCEYPVILITAEEAMENLIEAIEEYAPRLKTNKMSKEDIEALLDSYADCIIHYHPESYHQERAALLENFEILRYYGLTDDDYKAIDFC